MNATYPLNTEPEKLHLAPLLIAVATIFLFWHWYFSLVDLDWLVESSIASEAASSGLVGQEYELLKTIISPQFLKFSAISGEVTVFVVTLFMVAAYVTLFSRFRLPLAQQITMVKATNIAAWASLIVCLMHVLHGIYVFLTPEHKVELHQIDFFTLNNMVLSLPPESPFFTLANSISINAVVFIGVCSYLLHKEIKLPLINAVILYAIPYLSIWFIMFSLAVA